VRKILFCIPAVELRHSTIVALIHSIRSKVKTIPLLSHCCQAGYGQYQCSRCQCQKQGWWGERHMPGGGMICLSILLVTWEGSATKQPSCPHTPTPPIIATPSLKPCKMKSLKYLSPLVEDVMKSFGDTASWIQLAHIVGWQLEMDHLNFYTCDYDNCV